MVASQDVVLRGVVRPSDTKAAGERSADDLVQPLVVEGAFERGELVAEFFIMRRRHARIEGFAVAPYLY